MFRGLGLGLDREHLYWLRETRTRIEYISVFVCVGKKNIILPASLPAFVSLGAVQINMPHPGWVCLAGQMSGYVIWASVFGRGLPMLNGVAGHVAKASRHHQPVKCAQKNSRLRTEAGCLIYFQNLSPQITFCHSKRDGSSPATEGPQHQATRMMLRIISQLARIV